VVAIALTLVFIVIDIALARLVHRRLSESGRAAPINIALAVVGFIFLTILFLIVAVAAADADGYFTLAIWFALTGIAEIILFVSLGRAVEVERRSEEASRRLAPVSQEIRVELEKNRVHGMRRVLLRLQLLLLSIVIRRGS